MKRYEVTFTAIIEAEDQRHMLKTADRVVDAVACDTILMDTGDHVKDINVSEFWEMDEDEAYE